MDRLLPSSRMHLTSFMKKVRASCISQKDGSCGDSFILKSSVNPSDDCILLTVILVGKGCSWARFGGGCSMCGFYSVTTPNSIIAKDQLFLQFVSEMNKYKSLKGRIHLLIYTSGSFLDNDEISDTEQNKILNYISHDPRIIQVDLESLPRFITDRSLSRVKRCLKKTKFGISIGLESANETVRNFIIHKDYFTNNQLKAKAKIVKKYGQLKLNIILKPPLLTESEAIDDVLKSVDFSEKIGADFVYIAGCNVQKSTLNYYLWEKGKYSPPYLWSLYEIAKRIKHKKLEIVFGGFYDYPSPVAQASNCQVCNDKVIKSLLYFDGNIENISCKCIKKWEKIISEKSKISLEKRILNLYRAIDEECNVK